MIKDFLSYHNIPYPPHIEQWREYDHARILRFKGPVNSATIPGMLEFRQQMEKAGLPVKNIIFDGSKITDIDSAAVATLLVEMQKRDQKIGLVNPPGVLRSYLDIYKERGRLVVFATEEEALAAFNKPGPRSETIPDAIHVLQRYRSLSLLIALVAFLIALPFLEVSATAPVYLFLFSFVLLAGIYAVSDNMRHVAAGALLAVPTFITSFSNMFLQDQKILDAEMTFLVIFLGYTLTVILLHILSARKVTVNELFGAICVYIMIGMTFGVVYALLESLVPGSLAFPPGEVAPKMTAFYYFSFVSMSSTGFSGFTAVSSLARAIVIVQVIIGVMYVSALIGKLVSANTPDDDGLFDNMGKKLRLDFWTQELAENFFKKRTFLLVVSMAMLNYSSSVLMTVLKLPFFMDSWGTSLAVLLGKLQAGILSGVLYNIVMAFTFWGPASWVWMFCNIAVALLTWVFMKCGWVDLHKPAKLLGAGVITGVLNSVVVMVTTYAAQMPIYQGTMVVYRAFFKLTGNSLLSSVAEKVAVEVADKTISLLLVAVAVIFIHDLLHWKRSAATQSEGLEGISIKE